MLQLLFDARWDIGNVLQEQILHELLSNCIAKAMLATIMRIIEQLSGECWDP